MNKQIAYMIIARTRPIVIGGQVPIYWKLKVAKEKAEKHYGGKVVKVEINWTI